MVGMGAAHRLLDLALRDHGEFDVFGLLIRRKVESLLGAGRNCLHSRI